MALAYRERERDRDWDEVSRPSHSGYTVRRYPIHDRYDYEYDDREHSPPVPCQTSHTNCGQPSTTRIDHRPMMTLSTR